MRLYIYFINLIIQRNTLCQLNVWLKTINHFNNYLHINELEVNQTMIYLILNTIELQFLKKLHLFKSKRIVNLDYKIFENSIINLFIWRKDKLCYTHEIVSQILFSCVYISKKYIE